MRIALLAPAVIAVTSSYALARSSSIATDCKDNDSNAIVIRRDLGANAFQRAYYLNSSIFVPAVQDLYLDYVNFEKPCGVTYCNEEYKGPGRRDLTQIMTPKGSDCVLAHESISTFVCQGGQGHVHVHVDKKGRAAFTTDHPVAYFGSWRKKGCVTAAHDGKSSADKDYLIVDCTGQFKTGCVDEPVKQV